MQRVSARVALCWLALVLAGGARAAENLQPLTAVRSELRAPTATAVEAASGGGSVAAGRLLANGFPAQFAMSAVTPFSPGNFYNGDNGFSVIVPPGAGRLEVALTTSPGVDVVLYLRYGTDVAISGGAAVYDKSSEGTGGSTTIAVDPCTPLQAGTYYIAVLLVTQGVGATGTIEATIDGAPSFSACPLLSSGIPASFSLPAVTSGTLFRDDFSYRVAVPSGAGQLEVSLAATTPGVQVNLYVRFGADNIVSSGVLLTSYSATASGGNQLITITPSSSTPLAAGTYFISLGLLTTGAAVSGTITATVTLGGCTYAINPASQSFPASGGSGSVSVTAGSGCNWTASSNASFISISSGGAGSGNGTVNYAVAVNSSSSSRSGALTIAGQTFAVTEAGQPIVPAVTSSVSTLTFSATAGSNPPGQSFQVTSNVNYGITTDQTWLFVNPSTGLPTSNGNTHTASASASGLSAGSYTGHIVITASTPPALTAETPPPVPVSSISITVTLTITSGAGPAPVVSAAVNSASYANQALPSGAIAQGSIFTLFGQGVGPATLAAASQFPLQTSLGGVSVKVSKGSTSVDAIPLAVAGGQINAIMPSNAPTGQVQVAVTVNGRTSAPLAVQVAASGFGMFTANSNGMGPGIFTDPNFQIYTARRAAQPSQFALAWGTGLGGVSGPDNQAPPAGNLPAVVDITVGGKSVTNKTYSGRAPCCAGVDQIVFQIPIDAPAGCFVPVIIRVNGTPSNATTLPIDPNGGACSDPGNPLAALAATGGKLGAVELVRLNVSLGLFGALSADLGLAEFFQLPAGGDFAFNPILSLPPLGTCSVFSAGGIDLTGLLSGGGGALAGLLPSSIKPLKAGDTLTIQGPRGTKTVPLDKIDICDNTLGGQIPLLCDAQLPPYLDPGTYTVQGSGGADVGPFTVSIPIASPITWTNQQQLASVDRSQGATFTWTGGDPSQVILILGANADTQSQAAVASLCLASPGAGSFTVPPSILSAFPATSKNSFGAMLIGDLPSRNIPKFTAPGILAGAGLYGHLFGTLTTFK